MTASNRQKNTRAAVLLLCFLPGIYLSSDLFGLSQTISSILVYGALFLTASLVGYLVGTAFHGEEQICD